MNSFSVHISDLFHHHHHVVFSGHVINPDFLSRLPNRIGIVKFTSHDNWPTARRRMISIGRLLACCGEILPNIPSIGLKTPS